MARMSNHQLISARELLDELGNDALRVLDCRFNLSDVQAGRREYLNAHIPGAGFVDLNEDLAAAPGHGGGRHPLPSAESVAACFGRLGIDSSVRVVVYDGASGAMAARAWWMLRWLGHDRVRLLDGGLDAWARQQFPVESGVQSFTSKAFSATPRSDLIVKTDELVKAGKGIDSLNLLDARDRSRFLGEVEPIDRVAGHVPGARNMPFQDSLGANELWKARDVRRAQWIETLGGDANAASIAMCGSGVTACHLVLSAVDAGGREPRLYVGSWSAWIEDPGRPIAVGAA